MNHTHPWLTRWMFPAPLIALLLLGAGAAASAEEAGIAPPDDPDQADVDDWLRSIEARSDEIETLEADVRYTRIQMLLGDEQERFGKLIYDAGPPSRFAIEFDRVRIGDRMQRQQREFTFDGRWLAEVQADDQDRVFIRRELVPEDEIGQDLLRLGEGPFALPLDLQRDTVHERFEVELIPPDENAEDETLTESVQLRLTPRPGVEIDQSRIDLWYHHETLLPVQAHTINNQDQTESIIRMRNIELDVDVEEQRIFETDPPEEPGWQVEIIELDDR